MFSSDERIAPYEFRSLKGRIIKLEPKKPELKRVFLVIYGQHASIERSLPLVEALSNFGTVYLADNPGFGGMQSAYKAGSKPSLDFYADHLKNVYDNYLPQDKKVTLFAISFGLEMANAFLDKYPQYIGRTEDVLSFVGLASKRNLRISWRLRALLWFVCIGAQTFIGSLVYRLIMSDIFVRPFYILTMSRNPKFADVPENQKRLIAKEQAWLWRANDIRTHAKTAWDFLFFTDQTNLRIAASVTHVGVPRDHLLDNTSVIEDLKKIYKEVVHYELDLPAHAPISFETESAVLDLIPDKLEKHLKISENK